MKVTVTHRMPLSENQAEMIAWHRDPFQKLVLSKGPYDIPYAWDSIDCGYVEYEEEFPNSDNIPSEEEIEEKFWALMVNFEKFVEELYFLIRVYGSGKDAKLDDKQN